MEIFSLSAISLVNYIELITVKRLKLPAEISYFGYLNNVLIQTIVWKVVLTRS